MKCREEQVVMATGETVAACLVNHAKLCEQNAKPVIHAVTVTCSNRSEVSFFC